MGRATEHRVIESLDVEITVRDANTVPVLRGSFSVIHKELRGDQLIFAARDPEAGRILTLTIRAEQLEDVPPADPDHAALQERMRHAEDRVLARHQL